LWTYHDREKEKILDGRNRFLACQRIGITPTYTTFEGTPQDAIDHVWSTNMRRRHLTPSQAAMAEVKRKAAAPWYPLESPYP
jgi:hypothetical protein